jgi:ketosteroid isomerase-like protein
VNQVLVVLLLCAPCALSSQGAAAAAGSPQAAVDGLLAADRAFSAASNSLDVVAALSAMFSDDVVMPVPGGHFANGRAAAIGVLRGNPDNARSRIAWIPVRGGVSADGRHGFTAGSMTLRQPDATTVPMKYLAYWVKGPEGWRVVAYKRARAGAAQTAIDPMPPALPDRLVPPSSDRATIAGFTESLDQAERAFSRDAQRIGIGAAFALYGSADAINLGSPTEAGFVVGSEAIGRMVAEGSPPGGSAVSWAPDRVIVASSGDLGVTIGTIHRNAAPAAGQPAAFPFFTIWRRAGPHAPWRYVAE